MQGIYIDARRPASKEAVKAAAAERPADVTIEATGLSVFGNEYDGPVSEAPDGRYAIVGPDPYTSRKFYGTLTVRNGVGRVS